MTKQRLLVKFAMLAKTFLILSACQSFDTNKIPKITLIQIDANNNMANPFKVVKYNEKTCKMEVSAQKPFVLSNNSQVNQKLNGGYWISAEDISKLKVFGKTECENAKNN